MIVKHYFIYIPFLLIAFVLCGFYYFENKQLQIQQMSNFWQPPTSKQVAFEVPETEVLNWDTFSPNTEKMIFVPIFDGSYKMFAFYYDKKSAEPPFVQVNKNISFGEGVMVGKNVNAKSIIYGNQNYLIYGKMGLESKSTSLDSLVFISLLEYEKSLKNKHRTYIISSELSETNLTKELKKWNSSIQNIRFLPYELKGTARFLNTRLSLYEMKLWVIAGLSLFAVIATFIWLSKQRQLLLIGHLIGFNHKWLGYQIMIKFLLYGILPVFLILGAFSLISTHQFSIAMFELAGIPILLSLVILIVYLFQYRYSRGLK